MSEQKHEKEKTKEEKTKETLEILDEKIKNCEQKIKDVETKAKQKHKEAELKSKAGDEEGAKSLLAEEAKLLEQKKVSRVLWKCMEHKKRCLVVLQL